MHHVVLQLTAPEGIDDYAGLCHHYGINSAQADPEYGVRIIRPEQRQVALRVSAQTAGRLRAELYGEHAGRTSGETSNKVRVALVS
jgi:hypothetical protein